MIRIERLSDVNSLCDVNPLLRAYVLSLIASYCEFYECSEISEFGAFYIIENADELNNHTAYGLSRPLENTIFECSDVVSLRNSGTEITFMSVLVLINNDYGVNLFFDIKLLTEPLKKNLLSEYTREEIDINVSKRTVLN